MARLMVQGKADKNNMRKVKIFTAVVQDAVKNHILSEKHLHLNIHNSLLASLSTSSPLWVDRIYVDTLGTKPERIMLLKQKQIK